MPAPKNKYDEEHKRNLSRYEAQIDAVYKEAVDEMAIIGQSIGETSKDKPFRFADHPKTRKRVQRLLNDLQKNVQLTIVNGIKSEWELSTNKNDELARRTIGERIGRLRPEQINRYFNNHEEAREAFLIRKDGGLDLSQKVWNYTEQFKQEMELALDIGLGDGRSADALSRDLRQYLKHPDKLFRRVRDKHGQLHLSKAAKAYHPGRGVYRSSYKNARRLAATETNIAYRTADHLRWQDMDFVLGIEINLSNNHTLNGVPFTDICDDLAGKYPKDFNFVGWHPLCRCFATSVLKTEAEMDADFDRILQGEEPSDSGVNEVKDTPQGYKDWLKNNEERIKRAEERGKLPYFLRDNEKYYKTKPTALERVKKRHEGRTKEKTEAIQKRWDERKAERAKVTRPTPLQIAEQRQDARTPEQIEAIKLRAWDRQLRMHYPNISEEERKAITKNWLVIEEKLGIKKGRMMSIEEADKQSANPKYQSEIIITPNGKYVKYGIRYDYNPLYDEGYAKNCQTCSPAYMLRQWGFDVTAKPKRPNSLSEYLSQGRSFEAWLNVDGTPAKGVTQQDWLAKKGYKNMTEKRWLNYFEECCQEEGTYILTIGWKQGGAHATIIQKTSEGLFYIEPQSYIERLGAKRSIAELCREGGLRPAPHRGILRVDNKIFNSKFLPIFDC